MLLCILIRVVQILIICFQVALKTLRILDENDPKSKRLQTVGIPPNSMVRSIRVKSTSLLCSVLNMKSLFGRNSSTKTYSQCWVS